MLVCTSLLRNLVLEWYKIIVARCQCPCSLFIYVSLIVITCKNCVFTAGVQVLILATEPKYKNALKIFLPRPNPKLQCRI